GAPAAPRPVGPLSHVGRWLTDASGRAVILHGMNVIWKFPPFYPPSFSTEDARFFADAGFNAARIGFIYEGVEPRPGHYDAAYVGKVVELNRLMDRYGIQTLVDFHQDVYARKFFGDGFPEWAIFDDGVPGPRPGPSLLVRVF